MKSYTAMKRKNLYLYATLWMNLLNIMVSETVMSDMRGWWEQFTPIVNNECAFSVENLKTVIKLTKNQFFFLLSPCAIILSLISDNIFLPAGADHFFPTHSPCSPITGVKGACHKRVYTIWFCIQKVQIQAKLT